MPETKFYLTDREIAGLTVFGVEYINYRLYRATDRYPTLHLMERNMLFGFIPWGWKSVLRGYIYEKQDGFWRDRILSLSNVSDEQIAAAKADLMAQYEEGKARLAAIAQEAKEARKRKGFV